MSISVKLGIMGLLALTLTACGGPDPLSLVDIQHFRATDAQYGSDIYGARRAADEELPLQQGTEIVEIRTYTTIKGDDGAEQVGPELSGAHCEI